MAQTATGGSDAFISYKDVNEWDIAAGILVLKESSGTMSSLCHDLDQKSLESNNISFNKKNVVYHGIYGAHAEYHKDFKKMVCKN